MTVSQSLINWLYQFGGIEIDQAAMIETDQLDAMPGSYGLYKSAAKTVTPFINGTHDVSEIYDFVLRHSAKTDIDRVNNQAFLENLEKWVRTQNITGNLPEMDEGRACFGVAITSAGYMEATESDTASYQISIKIDYMEGIQ